MITTYNEPTGYVEPVKLFEQEKHALYWANVESNYFLTINQGGTSSGKSECIIRVMFTLCITNGHSEYRGLVTTNTIPKLMQDALAIALVVAEIPEVKMFIRSYNATYRVFTFTNGAKLEFNCYATEEEAKGPKYNIVYVTEATRIKYAVFYQLYLRCKERMYVDYNPTDTFYIHTKVIANQAEFNSVLVLRSDHRNNPYLSEEQHRRIENISDPETHRVYARGYTGRMRGTIYSNWLSINTEFIWRDGVLWYVDWGFSEKESADPVAAGRIVKSPKEYPELDFLVDELIYDRGVDPKHIAQVFKEAGYKGGQPCYCDHAPSANNELISCGITGAQNALKGPGSITTGLLYVRRKRIGYTARSKNVENEYKKYKYLEVDGIVTSSPIDEFNHHMDGIRYACYTNAHMTGNLK